MKKRLIALMCAGLVSLTTLVGCSEGYSKELDVQEDYGLSAKIDTVKQDTLYHY